MLKLLCVALVAAELPEDDECAAGSCALSALQLRGQALAEQKASDASCADLSDPANAVCAPVVRWAAKGGRYDPHAKEWFSDMESIAGVSYKRASLEDWQKLYFCAPPGGKQCGTPPCKCSKPPCDKCIVGPAAPPQAAFESCGTNPNKISCKPPKQALDYNGMAWDPMTVHGYGPFHVFAIGDWGGMDGTLRPIEGRPELIAYPQGAKAGPSVFPRTRWNKRLGSGVGAKIKQNQLKLAEISLKSAKIC